MSGDKPTTRKNRRRLKKQESRVPTPAMIYYFFIKPCIDLIIAQFFR